ncbi:6326_t:CDS:2 [Funneliformis geosporum]|nr:6326_t:CDS:2 [Funneliformis geosporum]
MAATTIPNTNNATTTNTLTAQTGINGPPVGHKINASEVGWLFVHEYYTFLNKDPSRLHCFYGQKSTLIHGTEGETVNLSQGEKEIKDKFQGLNLEDCRVLVTNVDSLASINGGIVIQVLGEMSNRNEVARRFAQTFFLDVQPNGYYVLNDIIRFQSDDEIEIYNGEEVAGASTSPAGTLVDEPIDVSSARVEQAGPSDSTQNTIITEPSLVTPRDTDLNMTVTFSTNPEVVPLHATPVDMEVTVPVVDDGGMHTQPPLISSIITDTSVQPPKPATIVQPGQIIPPSLLVVQNSNGQQLANVNEQGHVTTLTGIVSQEEAHATPPPMQPIQTYPSKPQSASVVSVNTQPPANLNKQEPAIALESHVLKKASLQGNNFQAPNSTTVDAAATSNVLTSSSDEHDKNGPQSTISKKSSEQSPTTNALQDVGQVPLTQIVSTTSGTQAPLVTHNRTEQPANIPKQASAQSPVVSVASQSQAEGHSSQSETENKVQISSNGPKSTSTVQKAPTTGSQPNDQGTKRTSRPGSPSGVIVCPVSSPAVNNKGQLTNVKQPVNKNNAHAVRKSSVQNIPKNVITTGSSDHEQQGVKSFNNTPQTKKTWASLAANGLEKWNNTALSEAKGVVAPVPAKSGPQQSQHMRDNRDRRSEGLKNNNRRNSVEVGGETVNTEERRARRGTGKSSRGRF